jgi:Domain of unknown function (DUF4440)
MRKLPFLVLFLAVAFLACGKRGQGQDEAREELLAKTQALLDGITHGDQKVFQDLLDPDGLFTDEEGHVYRAPAFVEEIRPLPKGFVGQLRMVDPQVSIQGDVGIVTFPIAETLDLYGQRLSTRYHATYVYRRGPQGWRLIALHNSVLPSELAPVPVGPKTFEPLAGTYRLGSDVTARVFVENGHLFMQRQGRDREELLPIGNDRFVRAGAARGERFFLKDASGKVTALVDRRDNNDLVWRRE